MTVPAGAIDLGDEPLVEAPEVGKAGQGITARAHPELALELAQTPMGVTQLLLEHPPLLIPVAEHVSSIGKRALFLHFQRARLDSLA
jgi:hypothetical protein